MPLATSLTPLADIALSCDGAMRRYAYIRSPGMATTLLQMEIISIEKKVFMSILSRLETLANKVKLLTEARKDKHLKNWLDNEDVCCILKINKRTLQSYRDKKILPYSQFVHKTYYKPADVQQLLESSEHLKTS